MRIVVDQSYTTHLRSCVISHTDQYCSTHTHQWYWTDYVQNKDYVLIEDDGFDRIVTQLSRYTSQACNVVQFKSIINREIALGKMDHQINTKIMTFLITETTVNQIIVASPRWHIWQIQCQVQLILLKSKSLPKHIINECKKWSIHIVPKSLYTIEYLNQHTKWDNYALVYVYEYMVKCVVIKNKQYDQLHYLNRWLSELKHLMKDMNVEQYYHHQHWSHINNLTQKLVTQSVEQYAHILWQWMSKYISRGTSIAMINDMSENNLVYTQCNNYLSSQFGFYTLECSHIMPRISKRWDIDGQVYASQHETLV